MRTFKICIFCVLFALVFCSMPSDADLFNEDDVLMKNISDLHFQLFSSIQKKTKMIKTTVFETQCSGSGCTFNGCESSGSQTCDGQMFTKLNKIQSIINDIWKRKPEAIVGYWIDFTDNGTEGKWVTLSTGKSEYRRWHGGQPDNASGNQHCAYNNYAKGFWDDVSCKTAIQVLCEASGSEF